MLSSLKYDTYYHTSLSHQACTFHFLIQVGFFRRKKKPDEGEVEGDFDVDQYKLKPPAGAEDDDVTPPEAPEAPEASAPPEKSEDITKV